MTAKRHGLPYAFRLYLLGCLFGGTAAYSNTASVTCRQIKGLEYLRAQAARLESDPPLQTQIKDLIDLDIAKKLAAQQDLSKCGEILRRPADTSSFEGASRKRKPSMSGYSMSGVVAIYAMSAFFVGMWGLLVTQ